MGTYKPVTLREMTPLELGWVAGLLEGEGSFYRDDTGGRRRIVISMGTTDYEVAERLLEITGVGNIYGPIILAGIKPRWDWKVRTMRNVEALCSRLLPLMSSRRQEAIRLLLGGGECLR